MLVQLISTAASGTVHILYFIVYEPCLFGQTWASAIKIGSYAHLIDHHLIVLIIIMFLIALMTSCNLNLVYM